jgi:hypothetical protein
VATIDPPISGVWVYLKVFDVDDPFDQLHAGMPNVNLIDGDAVGGDNRGGGGVGNYEEMTDALGRAVVPLVVSMQPGDNYRAAAATGTRGITGRPWRAAPRPAAVMRRLLRSSHAEEPRAIISL